MNDARAFLLERLPDEPANVDLRGILLAREVEIVPDRPDASGYAVHAPAIELACLWGTPDDSTLDALAVRVPRGTQVVCAEALRELVAPRFDSVTSEQIAFYMLVDGRPPSIPSGGTVRVVRETGDVDLSDLPAGLRTEMEAALERTLVAMTFVDERPVAFSYPHHETESYWDVSVDTLEAHRRQGHAGRAFGTAYEQLLAMGKQPVWGALQSNVASNQLALQLGFEPFLTRHLLIAAGAK